MKWTGGGGRGARQKCFEKSPEDPEDAVLWAGLEYFSIPKRHQFLH